MTGIVQSDASKTLIFVQWVNFVLLIYYFVPLLSNLFMPGSLSLAKITKLFITRVSKQAPLAFPLALTAL